MRYPFCQKDNDKVVDSRASGSAICRGLMLALHKSKVPTERLDEVFQETKAGRGQFGRIGQRGKRT